MIWNGNENREEDGEERKPDNIRSNGRGGLEEASKRATPTSKQQPQPQGSTPQRDPRTVRRTRAKGREARGTVGESGGGEKKRKKPQKGYDRCEVTTT